MSIISNYSCQFRIFLFFIFLAVSKFSLAQVIDKEIIAKADTSIFRPNYTNGWSTMFAYFEEVSKDSINLEVVLFFNSDFDFSNSQVVGLIKDPQFIPKSDRVIGTTIGRNLLNVLIDRSGFVWLKINSGPFLSMQRKVIPLVLRYSK